MCCYNKPVLISIHTIFSIRQQTRKVYTHWIAIRARLNMHRKLYKRNETHRIKLKGRDFEEKKNPPSTHRDK